jgi:hypothetical protein
MSSDHILGWRRVSSRFEVHVARRVVPADPSDLACLQGEKGLTPNSAGTSIGK